MLFPAKAGSAAPAPVEKVFAPTAGTGTILVIDDEDLVRTAIKSGLERRGYSVMVAEDGVEGIETYRTHADEIALIIMDLTMPRMSGEETLRHLRALNPAVPVMLSSGYSEAEATRKFVGKGLASFLQKPFTFRDLVSAVDAALNPPVADE